MPTLPLLDQHTQINSSPHVVILGAGASLAACPNGDKSQRRLPLMRDIAEKVGLTKELIEAGFSSELEDFEALYDNLVTSKVNPDLVARIEQAVVLYFASLELPDEPNLYDYLLTSLREKDLVATFNWDPFLAQAYRRNAKIKRLPKVVFLHGNVEIGICDEHKRVGFIGECCGVCKKSLRGTKLLYPVRKKDYATDPFIRNEWQVLQNYLKHAYFLTIFGYSAPKTDVEARSLMLNDWQANPTLQLAEVEIIDIKSRSQIEATWEEFFVSHHYQTQRSIFDSYLFRHPSRSCDAFAAATLMCKPWQDNNLPKFENLGDLHRWLDPLLKEEGADYFSGLTTST